MTPTVPVAVPPAMARESCRCQWYRSSAAICAGVQLTAPAPVQPLSAAAPPYALLGASPARRFARMRSARSVARFTACMRVIALLPACREMPNRLATPNMPTASTTNATSISIIVNPRGRAGRCCMRRGCKMGFTCDLLRAGACGEHIRTGRAHASASAGRDQHRALNRIGADHLIASAIAEQDVARRRLGPGGACESGRKVHLDAVIVGFDSYRAVEQHVPLEDGLAVIKLPGVGAGPGGGAAIPGDDPSGGGAGAARGDRLHWGGPKGHG